MPAHADDTVEPELDTWPFTMEPDSFQQEPELNAWPSTTELPVEVLPGLSTPEPSVLPETNAGGSTCCHPRRGQRRRGRMPPLEDEDLAFELLHITAPSRSDVVHTLDEGPQMFDCSLVRRMQQGADAPRLLSLRKRKPVQWQVNPMTPCDHSN